MCVNCIMYECVKLWVKCLFDFCKRLTSLCMSSGFMKVGETEIDWSILWSIEGELGKQSLRISLMRCACRVNLVTGYGAKSINARINEDWRWQSNSSLKEIRSAKLNEVPHLIKDQWEENFLQKKSTVEDKIRIKIKIDDGYWIHKDLTVWD